MDSECEEFLNSFPCEATEVSCHVHMLKSMEIYQQQQQQQPFTHSKSDANTFISNNDCNCARDANKECAANILCVYVLTAGG